MILFFTYYLCHGFYFETFNIFILFYVIWEITVDTYRNWARIFNNNISTFCKTQSIKCGYINTYIYIFNHISRLYSILEEKLNCLFFLLIFFSRIPISLKSFKFSEKVAFELIKSLFFERSCFLVIFLLNNFYFVGLVKRYLTYFYCSFL